MNFKDMSFKDGSLLCKIIKKVFFIILISSIISCNKIKHKTTASKKTTQNTKVSQHNTIEKQDSKVTKNELELRLLSKKIDKILVINDIYLKHISEEITDGFADLYNTEISLGSFIKTSPNLNTDYNIAISSIKHNNLDKAIEILSAIKTNLTNAIENEIKMQEKITEQIANYQDNLIPEKSIVDKKLNTKDTKKITLSQKLAETNNYKPINYSEKPQDIRIFKTSYNAQFDYNRLKFFYNSLYHINYLLGYVSYAKKDYRIAINYFLENYNIEDNITNLIPQETFFQNTFALAYSFFKIFRYDKYCELITITKINDRKTFPNIKLYEQINVSLPVFSCTEYYKENKQ